MTNTTPDQSRTPELPVAVATIQIDSDMVTFGRVRGIDTVCDGLHYLYTLDQLREYGRARVAAIRGWSAEDACEQFLAAEVDSAPDALRRLGDWLSNILDEDREKTAASMVLGAMLETSAAIRAAASPPPDVQEAEPVAHAEYTPVSEAHEAAIDEALGLTKMILRFPTELMATLRSEADAKGVVLAAHIRDRLSHPPSGDAEDARDAARYRCLRGALYQDDVEIGEAYVRMKVIGACPTQVAFDAAVDAMLAKGVG